MDLQDLVQVISGHDSGTMSSFLGAPRAAITIGLVIGWAPVIKSGTVEDSEAPLSLQYTLCRYKHGAGGCFHAVAATRLPNSLGSPLRKLYASVFDLSPRSLILPVVSSAMDGSS